MAPAETVGVAIGDASIVDFAAVCATECPDLTLLRELKDEVSVGITKALGHASCNRCGGPVETIFDGALGCGITTPVWMKEK